MTVGMQRADRVAAVLEARDVDLLLVTAPAGVRWLTGFTGSNGLAVVGAGPDGVRRFHTDFRYVTQVADQLDAGWERAEPATDLLEAAAAALSGPARLGFDDGHLSVRQHRRLGELLPEGVEAVPACGVVEELRAVKDADEIARIRAAARLADAAFERVVGRGLVGRTEREVALDLEVELRRAGAEAASFEPIVAAGAHGALPHAQPRDVEIPSGTLVVCDWGAQLDGYCSDCTRTVATGPLDGEEREVYEVVRDAQAAAVAALRPGPTGRAVDAVARERIEAAGHGERFGHGLGHGVGIEVHEAPRLSRQGEDPLRAGNVVTVEPGVYLPGRFGVRIEDLVVVTDDGHDVLTGLARELRAVD